ncbi:MAG: glycosyl hydrolase-related protein [Candidatus Delongbacteria bacterium]
MSEAARPESSPLQGSVHVVSHTHWDREWYLPYQTFRVRLVNVVDQVLELLESDSGYRHFMLDGQAVALEDYLEIRPEAAGRVRRRVEEGRLSIGPWSVLPDQFLVSGEATVRNLLLGHASCAPLGGVSRAGYMPDTFGHIAQLPQLLRRAGLDSFIYWRGHGDECVALGSEWIWEAPDGSRVLAVNQVGGYCNASALGYEEIWEILVGRQPDLERAARQFLERLERVAAASHGRVWLLNNGCDHHPPQPELPAILERVRQLAPGLRVQHSTLEAFLEELRSQGAQLPGWRGELRAGRQAHLLSGVLSARLYLKQENERCQRLLAEELEPLEALLHAGGGRGLPDGLLREAWRLLLRNHPHDSICGCSTDEVHTEMESRFAQLRQLGEEGLRQLMGQATALFAPQAAGDLATCLTAWNPLPFPRRDAVRRWVILLPEDRPVEELELVDEAGRPLPFRVLERHWLERFWGIDYRSCVDWREQDCLLRTYLERFGSRIVREAGAPGLTDQFVLLEFQPELPALALRHFHLRPRIQAAPEPPLRDAVAAALISAEGAWLENAALKVWLKPDGRFDLQHKASGRRWNGLGLLEDQEDAGDEYDYSPAAEPELHSSAGRRGLLYLDEDTGLGATLRCEFSWPLPAGLTPDRRRRSAERIDCPVVLRLRLRADCPLLDLEVEVDNRVRDHRLRFVTPSGLVDSAWYTHGQFELRRRPLTLPDGADWVQPPQGTAPVQEFSLLEAEDGLGLALFNLGLPEVEARVEADGTASLVQTLLRGVEWLSRDDFSSRRRQNAGPTLFTPGAQCPGRRRARLALLPYTGGWQAARVREWSRRWRVEPLLRQGVDAGRMPEAGPLLEQDLPQVVEIAALRRQPARGSLIVRLCNLAEHPVRETLRCGQPLRAAWRCSLLEEREAPLATAGMDLQLELGPAEILTVELELASN